MQHITPIRPGEAPTQHVNNLLEEAQQNWWNDSAFFGLLGHHPPALDAVVGLFKAAVSVDAVPTYILELMRLKMSEINQCDYCVSMRFAAVKSEVQSKEEAIFGEIDGAELTKQEFLCVRLAEQMAQSPNDIPAGFFAELKEEFTNAQVVQLVFAAAAFSLGNKINSTLQLHGLEVACSLPHG